MSEQLTPAYEQDRTSSIASPYARHRIRLSVCSALIFAAALGIRLLHWQDIQADIHRSDTLLTNLVKPYTREVNRIKQEGGILFPSQPPDAQDARMILHPPGYSILMVAIEVGDSNNLHRRLRWLAVIGDAITAAMIFLIAAPWFPLALAIVAGMLVALSPHLAHYPLWLTPETLAVLPVALAVYLIARGVQQPRLWTMIAAGALVGVSCWLRSNGLLLAPFLALAVFLLVARVNRLKYSAALVGAMAIVISPITLRNWLAYHRFVPLSLGAGITMAEGIADFDDEKRFGMPVNDEDAKHKDAEWHNRPDYAGNLWVPDGVERDRARFARGLLVVRSNPGWFLGVMLRRAASMLRYADGPVASKEPAFDHSLSFDRSLPAWTISHADLALLGRALSPEAEASITPNSQTIRITSDNSSFGDQFASAPIPVEKNSDYVLLVSLKPVSGLAAIKVTTSDRRITLGSTILDRNGKRKKREGKRDGENETSDIAEARAREIELAFASGDRREVLLVVSNNGVSQEPRVVEIGGSELYRLGPTPQLWTRMFRPAVRGIQRNLYTTTHLLPLIGTGISLLALARRWRALLIILVVPAYYLCVQSAFHTEYRYILAIHYFLFVLGAVTLYLMGAVVCGGARRVFLATRRAFD